MNESRDDRVESIFASAEKLGEAERGQYLDRTCGDDRALRSEVERMLDMASALRRPEPSATIPGPALVQVSLDDEQQAWVAASEDLLERLARHTPPETKHEVLEEVGRGGMGTVYRVLDTSLNRTLAMKVIGETAVGTGTPGTRDPKTMGRFLQEAQVTGQLHHPGIVPVHDLGLRADGELFFTMRFVKGSTFGDVIDWVGESKEGWSQTRALGVLLDVLEAMAYAHSRGVIHRDLKPSNVMVGRFGETYVLDWGVAHVLGQPDPRDLRIPGSSRTVIRSEVKEDAAPDSPLITMDGLVIGTPSFMSPEQALGMVEQVDARSDVYSVGAMLYHLLTGQMPYVPRGARVSPRTIHSMVIQGPPRAVQDLNPQVAPELAAICETAMARDRDRRYADTRAMADDLRAFLEDRVVKAHRTGAVIELRKWVRRNRGTAVSVAAALFVVVTSLLALYLREQATRRRVEAAESETSAKNLALIAAQDSARQYLDDYGTLADAILGWDQLSQLTAESDDLWPTDPRSIPRMEEWLNRASAALALSTSSGDPADDAARGGELQRGNLAPWALGPFRKLHATFTDPDPRRGALASMQDRLEFADLLREDQETHGAEWEDAITAITFSDRYGFEMDAQFGLRPLGIDLDSGLWEFRQVLPERTPEGGLVLDAEHGVVLVLVPGGTVTVGSQSEDARGAHHDPLADPGWPVRELVLDPFFIGKYELTQDQWSRMVLWSADLSPQPSHFPLMEVNAPDHALFARPDPGSMPVEQVGWDDCNVTLRCFGLELPTEAQWEYAVRGGTGTPWWTGSEAETVHTAGNANLLDRTCREQGGADIPGQAEGWKDGRAFTAPFGRSAANAFGLHEVLGNVLEWCRDDPGQDLYGAGDRVVAPLRDGDGLQLIEEATSHRIFRGGCWSLPSRNARSSNRESNTYTTRYYNLGVRVSRPVKEKDQ